MSTFNITVKTEVEEKNLAYCLCAGMEGGIGYWAQIIGYKEPSALAFTMDKAEGRSDARIYKHIDYPMNAGGEVHIKVIDGDVNGKTGFILTRKKLIKGLELMSAKYPHHFANFMRDTGDAETGDVLIQLALFGEIVFG